MTAVPDIREILAFEATAQHEPDWWRERAVRARWNIPLARYTARLLDIIAIPEALFIEPQLVARLRRIRDLRRSVRSARRIA